MALARAFVIEPGVLLMDEPLSNLDAKLRVQTVSYTHLDVYKRQRLSILRFLRCFISSRALWCLPRPTWWMRTFLLYTSKARRLAIGQKILCLPVIAIYKGGEKVAECVKDDATVENIKAMIEANL